MPNRTLAACLVTAGLVSCSPAPDLPQPPSITLYFEPVLSLGTQSADFVLGDIQAVTTDSLERIYVVDPIPLQIKVFDAQGNFLHALGGRGKEAGRFLDISSICVTPSDELVAVDGMSGSVSRFDAHGKLLARNKVGRSLGSVFQPAQMWALADGRFLCLYEEDGRLFHIVDQAFQARLESFGDASRYRMTGHPVEELYQGTYPGFFWPTGSQEIVYSPALYSGRLSRFRQIEPSRPWAEADVFRTYAPPLNPLTPLSDLSNHPRVSFFKAATAGKEYGAILNHESRGIFLLEDGRLAHFTLTRGPDDSRSLGVFLLDRHGRTLGYGELANTSRNPVEASYRILWKDSQDRFYVRRGGAEPALLVVRLKVQPQPPGSADPMAVELKHKEAKR